MIGQRIKFLRNEKKLLQKELAEQLNLSQQTISLYESEKREPDYTTLKNIADFFDVSVDYLLGRTDIKEPIKQIIDSKIQNSKSHIADALSEDINNLSQESQEELKKLIELYKIRDMQKRNTELSDELANSD